MNLAPGSLGLLRRSRHPGEQPLDARRRELREKLELECGEAEYFTRFDFDLTRLGAGRSHRTYYVVRVSAAGRARLALHEGQAFDAFPGDAVCRHLRVTPYDAFALFLHHSRGRIRPGGA